MDLYRVRLTRYADAEDREAPIPFRFVLCYNLYNHSAVEYIIPRLLEKRQREPFHQIPSQEREINFSNFL